MEAKAYGDIEQFALQAILLRPQDTESVVAEQKARVQSLLAEQKYDAALVQAKSYYDVATLKATGGAIELFADALSHARGKNEPNLASKFLAQQAVGARSPNTVPSSEENALNTVSSDLAPYSAAIEKAKGDEKYDSLMARGNLLLLAGKAAEAQEAFLAACQSRSKKTNDTSFFAAVEGVARAIRAEEGVTGPSCALVLALALNQETDLRKSAFDSTQWKSEDLQLAGQRILLAQLSAPANGGADLDQAANSHSEAPISEVAAEGMNAASESSASGKILCTLDQPVVVVSLSPSVDTPLVEWFDKWDQRQEHGQADQAVDRIALIQILGKTRVPSLLLFQVAHAIQFRSLDNALPGMFYSSAAHRADEELREAGQSPQAVGILRGMKDHMGGYKAVLWPLIEHGDSNALDALYTIYTSYTRWIPPKDKSLAMPVTHMKIGTAECLYAMGKADESVALLESIKGIKMASGEMAAFDWAYGLGLYRLGRYSEAIPRFQSIVSRKDPYEGEALPLLAVSQSRIGNVQAAHETLNDWVRRYTPDKSRATYYVGLVQRRVKAASF
jgi:hypothetical protein